MRANRPLLSKQSRTNILGYLLILPMLAGFIIFVVIPLIQSIRGSFYTMNRKYWNYDDANFCGLANFQYLFADTDFIKAITNTLYLMIGIPIGMFLAFFLATLINSKYSRVKRPYLILYYLPAVSSAIAIGLVWKWLFNREAGLINNLFNIDVGWLTDRSIMKITLIMKGVWGGVGGTLLLYYASLQNIPTSLYEAADIVGANPFQKMFKITIPLINPTTFYILVTGVIGGIMAFADNYVISADKSCMTIVYYLYTKMVSGQYGYVCAGSMLVFGALFLVTLLQFYLNKKMRGSKK